MVAHLLWEQGVAGSSPVAPTIILAPQAARLRACRRRASSDRAARGGKRLRAGRRSSTGSRTEPQQRAASRRRLARLPRVRGVAVVGHCGWLEPYGRRVPPLPRVTGREILRALRQLGWEVVAQRGSHAQLRHPERRGRVTVPCTPARRSDPASCGRSWHKRALAPTNSDLPCERMTI